MSKSSKHTVTVAATVVLLFSALADIIILIGHRMAADRAVPTRGQRPAPSDTRPEVTTP
ncbi:hypothetical protein [Amycolatopsis sp. cmx-4-68]|uniref:hypothetical protein n=1 Tax=Amycolatopsis sp. cmx-4-68 TaxID=2790938 RepID=UPI00397AC1C1